MSRIMMLLLLLLGWLTSSIVRADTAAPPPPVDVVVDNTVAHPAAPARDITVAFTSPADGRLFQSGQAIELSAVINSKAAQQATVTTLVSTLDGCQIFLGSEKLALPEGGEVTRPLTFADASHLPNGAYRVEVWVVSDKSMGYGTTQLGVWDGPLGYLVDSLGISYAGPLNSERTWRDLDLFKMAGIGWLRFPLQGWLPQGQPAPTEAEQYNMFVQEASKRGFSLLAAFTPKTTVDSAVDAVQADKEYRESLLAAATRYLFKVKNWELLRVKPDPKFPELHGIGFVELAAGQKALKALDKKARTVFSVDNPFKWNALELFNQSLPDKNDVIGMRYNFLGIPELQTDNVSPSYAIGEVNSDAQRVIHREPPVWVTEQGFDPRLGDRLPDATMQAALMSRALILNRAMKIERTFWRYNPAEQREIPFIGADGSAQVNLLALRTTAAMLDGVTEVLEVPSPLISSQSMPTRVWNLLLRKGPRKGERGGKAHYILAAWWETRDARMSSSLTVKTSAMRVTVTDLWGNTIELQPTSQAAVFTVDAFPRFVDLGTFNDAEVYSPFAYFEPSVIQLTEGGENMMRLVIHNDQRFFRGKIVCDVNTRRWPGELKVKTQNVELGPADRSTLTADIAIPSDARKGELYQVSSEILLGTRRIGYLTIPVWYSPKEEKPPAPAKK